MRFFKIKISQNSVFLGLEKLLGQKKVKKKIALIITKQYSSIARRSKNRKKSHNNF